MLAVTGGKAGYALDRQPFALFLTPRAKLESPINIKCISLEYERKSEYSQRHGENKHRKALQRPV